MDIVEKLKDVADKKDIDILAKHLVCHEAANEIDSLRQQLAEQTSAETVYQVWDDEVQFWADCGKNHYDNFATDDKRVLYTAPPSVEVLLEALREMVEMMDSGDEHGEGSDWHIKAKAALSSYKPTEG
jgi:hypothetical protein